MATTPTFADFEALWARSRELQPAAHERCMGLQREFEAEVQRRHAERFPRSKKREHAACMKALGMAQTKEDPTFGPLIVRADALWEEFFAAEKALRAEMEGMAVLLDPPTGLEMHLHEVVSSNGYRSQGYGANHYAKASADRHVADAARWGLRAEVRLHKRQVVDGIYGGTYEDYAVYADTSPAGWALVQHKPAMPLREWVASCWKARVNPRVMCPHLPHDIEERLGVDYFGNLVEPVAAR